jgi:hypothetical protein
MTGYDHNRVKWQRQYRKKKIRTTPQLHPNFDKTRS